MDKQTHSDDGHLDNKQPMCPKQSPRDQLPPDANSEMSYDGDGEDYDDGDEDQAD